LLAASDDVNREKSDHGPDQWHPPDPAAWCRYAVTYRNVKFDWRLVISASQAVALTEMCPGVGQW